MPKLILASTSPYRREQLARLGIPFRWAAPGVDEEALKGAGLPPRELAARLAEAKAAAVGRLEPSDTDFWTLGGDQVASCAGRLLGKPGSAAVAIEQLEFLAGKEHELSTSFCLWSPARSITHTDIAILRMRSLTRAEIERYVAADQPLDCAGSYKLEARGIALFESVSTPDQTAITGLPLIALSTLLRERGFVVP